MQGSQCTNTPIQNPQSKKMKHVHYAIMNLYNIKFYLLRMCARRLARFSMQILQCKTLHVALVQRLWSGTRVTDATYVHHHIYTIRSYNIIALWFMWGLLRLAPNTMVSNLGRPATLQPLPHAFVMKNLQQCKSGLHK